MAIDIDPCRSGIGYVVFSMCIGGVFLVNEPQFIHRFIPSAYRRRFILSCMSRIKPGISFRPLIPVFTETEDEKTLILIMRGGDPRGMELASGLCC